MSIWAILFKGHIHTNAYGGLAVFHKRRDAVAWMNEHAIDGCRIVRFIKAP